MIWARSELNSGGGRVREVGAPQSGETLFGGLEGAEGFDLSVRGGIVGVDEARGAERAKGRGDGVVGDGVEGAIVRAGAGGLRGVEMLEEELGEEVRLVQAVELGAEVVEVCGERAEMGYAALFPVTDEGEPVVDDVAGFVGEVAGERRVGDGNDEVAEGIAAGAAGEEGKLGGGRVGAGQVVEGEEIERLRGGVADGGVAAGG